MMSFSSSASQSERGLREVEEVVDATDEFEESVVVVLVVAVVAVVVVVCDEVFRTIIPMRNRLFLLVTGMASLGGRPAVQYCRSDASL
jgi:hypothetical protein